MTNKEISDDELNDILNSTEKRIVLKKMQLEEKILDNNIIRERSERRYLLEIERLD